MKGIPTNKATQTAHIIREAIDRGEWAQHLPGERTLAKDLMISRACLRKALEILTTEKVLSPVEKSKRRTILQKATGDITTNKVIFLSPEPAHRAAPMVLEQVAQLRYYLLSRGIRIPEDISLISLSHDKVLDCFSPLPVSYTVGDLLIRSLTQMIINPANNVTAKPSLLIPEMKMGKTVAKVQG